MKRLMTGLILLGGVLPGAAQAVAQEVIERPVSADPDAVFETVEIAPAYASGKTALFQQIAMSIRYPAPALDAGLQGRVPVSFIVEPDGTISEIEAMERLGGGLEEEAIRIVGTLGTFEPGLRNGSPVRTRMVIPITFKLAD